MRCRHCGVRIVQQAMGSDLQWTHERIDRLLDGARTYRYRTCTLTTTAEPEEEP